MSFTYNDVFLVDGVRTAFADYNSVLKDVSATDLGIAVAKGVLAKTGVAAADIDVMVAGNVAQSSLDALYIARHIGLYAGLRLEVPALGVARLCCSGFEAIVQGADNIVLGRARTALCVGTESMSRYPVASYTMRSGYRLGGVDFADFLWECTLDTASKTRMGETAENLAKKYGISREQVDEFAARSFAAALTAQANGFHAGEIMPLVDCKFEREGLQARGIKLPRKVKEFAMDEHARPTSLEQLAALKPAFGGVQTGGNSSAIVDGAAGVVVAGGDYVRAKGLKPIARIVAAASVGCLPEIMGIGPAPAIRAVLEKAKLALGDIDRFEINEAFGAQYLAVEKELGLDRNKVNVNGGAIAIGHPLGTSGVRCTLTLARELVNSGLRYGVASACAGGGQGTAILIERV